MNALVVHTDSLTVAMESVIALAGLPLGVGLIWTIRFRSAPTDPPAIALRRAEEAPGSAQDRVDAHGLGDDFESENAS